MTLLETTAVQGSTDRELRRCITLHWIKIKDACRVDHLQKEYLFALDRVRDLSYRLTDAERGFIRYALYGNTDYRIYEEGRLSEAITHLLNCVVAYATNPTPDNLAAMLEADF